MRLILGLLLGSCIRGRKPLLSAAPQSPYHNLHYQLGANDSHDLNKRRSALIGLDYKAAQINVREANVNIRVLATGRTFTAHLTTLEGIRETIRTLFRSTLYNPAMNKRARKRLKEAIEKKNLERQRAEFSPFAD